MSKFVTVKQLVFTGDFLRPNVAGDRPTQHHNIRWLQNLVSTQIGLATGLPAVTVAWGADNINNGRLTSADVQAIYGSFGLSCNINSWAQVYGLTQLPDRFEVLLNKFFADSLVVCFELPPYLEHYFNSNRIPFLAAAIHPVRFLDDIFLSWRSNVPEIQDALFSYRIDQSFVKVMAGIQSASAAHTIKDRIKPNSALFVMQTWYDQSQILDGEFVSAERYLDEIGVIGRNYEEILIKEHPLAPNPATMLIEASVPNLRKVDGNVYGYLSMPEISLLGTLSSSVGVEAPYFGVPTRFLLRDPMPIRQSYEDPPDAYIGIKDAFLNPDFWRDLCKPITETSAYDNIRIPYKPNRLRISLRNFWNFNQIDTDVAGFLRQ